MTEVSGQPPLLLVEDDLAFATALGTALRSRGFAVTTAATVPESLSAAQATRPAYSIVDLKLGDDSGLTLIPHLIAQRPSMRILLLTGYASIATAVEAIKLGAHDYLAKPVDADMVAQALLGDTAAVSGPRPDVLDSPMPLRRLEWEHIQRTLQECDGNISRAAKKLGIHRRTLQRRLDKHPVRERP